MATLEQVGERVATQLRERGEGLVSAVQDNASDFAEIAGLADAVGELADEVAEIYVNIDEMLKRGFQGQDGDDSQQGRGEEPARARREQSEHNGGQTAEDVTKEELLERAREVNVQGRSSMTKDELAEAVETEESLTKEELLDRAREAGVEGRSSMTKEELREALRQAGAHGLSR